MSTTTGSLERRLSRTQLSLTERAVRAARAAADLQNVACMQKPAHAFVSTPDPYPSTNFSPCHRCIVLLLRGAVQSRLQTGGAVLPY
jgi:hypothetical protein